MLFYSSKSYDTQEHDVLEATERSKRCIHSMIGIQQWQGDEALHQTLIKVPSLFMAYNLFMNGMDWFDQLRAPHVTEQKKRRVPMSILTFILEASIINGYALFKSIADDTQTVMPLRGFKRRFVRQWLCYSRCVSREQYKFL